MASALIFPKIDGFERGGGDLGRSLTLAAFVARNGPPDHFVRLRRTVPHYCWATSAEIPAPWAPGSVSATQAVSSQEIMLTVS